MSRPDLMQELLELQNYALLLRGDPVGLVETSAPDRRENFETIGAALDAVQADGEKRLRDLLGLYRGDANVWSRERVIHFVQERHRRLTGDAGQ